MGKIIMTSEQFVEKLLNINTFDTIYILGAFGAPMNAKNKARYTSNQAYNATTVRKNKINACNDSIFGFDCIGLVRAALGGWYGDKNRVYGGTEVYRIGNEDYYGKDKLIPGNADAKRMMVYHCKNISTDFSSIKVGEFLWLDGHCGVYIGNGRVIECTPKVWDDKTQPDGVQISWLSNLGYNTGHCRTWTKHGELEWVDYSHAVVDFARESMLPSPSTTTGDLDSFSGKKVTYIIQKGDTLNKIAKKFSSTVEAICEVNRITNPNLIVAGATIEIPTVESDGNLTYTIKPGDTLSAIAKKYGTTYIKLALINGIVNPNKITAGQVIKLK